MKKPRLLLCMLALASLAIFTACDDDDEGDVGGDGRNNPNLAPTSLSGRTMNVVVFDGTSPFGTNGTYNIQFTSDTAHTILDEVGSQVTSGTYTYTRGADDDATIVFQDNRGTVTSDLVFDSGNSGTIDSRDTGTGTESADFTLQ